MSSTVHQHHQRLPTKHSEREALRDKGQFWTPDWVADAMTAYVLQDGCSSIFDPAVGAGAFLLSAKRIARSKGIRVSLRGCELHPEALQEATRAGLTSEDLAEVEIRDYILDTPTTLEPGIVANPPYIRHHRIDLNTKRYLSEFSASLMSKPLDGRAGLHVYFLIKSLLQLAPLGRLAYILPADTFEGVFSRQLWDWVVRHYRIDAVITFEPEATPFPGVDTNAIILMAANAEPVERIRWLRCRKRGTALRLVVDSGFALLTDAVEIHERTLQEALETGMSRPPLNSVPDGVPLYRLARVVRGIATGANEFFFLNRIEIAERNLPLDAFVRAVGRTRDISGEKLTLSDLETLDRLGRPTYLLYLSGTEPVPEDSPLGRYLAEGFAAGLPRRALIASRSPWYRMERREPPPILFTYLGRQRTRFIRNEAKALPLTGFLCVYPATGLGAHIDALFHALNDPRTTNNLRLVAKTYGSGAIKVEPRGLDRLVIPHEVLSDYGLEGVCR